MKAPATVLHVLGTGDVGGQGIANLVQNLAEHINPSRYRVAIVLLGRDGAIGDKLRKAGLSVTAVDWTGGSKQLDGIWRFTRAVSRLNPDIVHLHSGGLSARLAAKAGSKRRIIMHFHSVAEESGRATVRKSTGADLVIANSGATAKTISGGKVVVIHPGVKAIARRSPKRADPSRPIAIGIVARLVPVKGLDFMIGAMSLLMERSRSVTLEVAGIGPERERLERETARAGLADVIRFIGWRDDVRALMVHWDIYVQPSLSEGFGIAAVEAMAQGLPVVATRVGGLPEVVMDTETGILVPPRDSIALADAIDALINDPALRLRMGNAGRERATGHFSLEREADTMQRIYDRLLQ
jgi:glycosyltransferase involved in cell wall biosynthesis